ncbi:MAG TPA: DedA family protein [Methylocella sp.]|nr:DedA family protein [Methylocella sp.]
MFLAQIQPLVVTHGYWVVFLIIMLESAGIPLPGETVLVLAAGYAGATGDLDITLVIAFAVAGAILGDNLGFWCGRTWGTKYLLRYGKFVHLSESRLRIGEYLFQQHGAKIVYFGRFIAFLRIFAALLAGVNRYRWPQFLFFNATGGLTWALFYGIGAYRFGDWLRRVSGPLGIAALIGVIIGVIAFSLIVRREEKKLEARLSSRDGDLRSLS